MILHYDLSYYIAHKVIKIKYYSIISIIFQNNKNMYSDFYINARTDTYFLLEIKMKPATPPLQKGG